MEIITLQNFIKTPIEDIKIKIGRINSSIFHTTTYEVILIVNMDYEYTYKVNKRYTEFEGLYESLTYRYHNITFPKFPSKTQVFNKEETRKKFFDSLLMDILMLSSIHKEIRKELLSIIYEFIFKNENKKGDLEFPANNSMSLIISNDKNKRKNNSIDLTDNRSILNKLNSPSRNESSFNHTVSSNNLQQQMNINPYDVSELTEKMHKDGWFIEYCYKSHHQSNYVSGYLKFSDNCLKIHESILSNNFQIIFPLYGAEYDLVRINKKLKIKTVSLIDLKEAYDKIKNLVASQKLMEKEIFIKEILSEVNIRLYHPHDKEDFYIRINHENHKFKDLMKVINNLEMMIKQKASNTRYIKKIDETNSFIYGKISLDLRTIEIENLPSGVNTFAIISLQPYEFHTKTAILVENRKSSISINSGNNSNSTPIQNTKTILENTVIDSPISKRDKDSQNSISKISIKDNLPTLEKITENNPIFTVSKFEFFQTFVLPIHNKFEKLKIEIFTKNLQGVFSKREIDEKISEHDILISDIMNTVCFGDKKYLLTLENKNKNVKAGKIIVNLKIFNYTSIMSNFAKIKNKNVLEDMSFEKSEEDLSIKKLFKRLKKILILIKDFKEYYKTLFRFKYPYFSFLIMISSIIYFLFFDIKYFLVHLLFFMFLIAFFHSFYYKNYIACYINEYIYGTRNKMDFDTDDNAMTRGELEEGEVKKETYLIDKGQKTNIMKIFIEPIKTYKNYRDAYHKVLFKFTKYVSNLEKMKNLFLFTDPIISIYFMALLIFGVIIIYNVEFRYLMLFVILKKFSVGFFYYKKKYINNLEIANIILKYCHQEYKSKQKIFSNLENHINKVSNNLNNVGENKDNKEILQTVPDIKENNEFEYIDYKIKLLKNAENMVISHDIDNVLVIDDKFKLFIKEQLERHSDLVLNNEFLGTIAKMGEIKEVIGRCKGMLKIKKDSNLFDKTINNQKIYRESLDADQIFVYFVQNVKSDFYLTRYYYASEETAE